jgi:tetratricopeptide (TPR) repeat protein
LPPRQALIEIQLRKSEFALALQSADETLAYDPANFETRLFRAQALQGLKKLDEARKEYQVLLKLNPKSADAMFQLGMLEMSANGYQAATRIFEQCMQSATDNFLCVIGVSEAYTRQEQYDKAIAFLSGELKKTPDRRELRQALANTSILTGEYLAKAGKYDAAMSKYNDGAAIFSALLSESIARKEPESADLRLRLGESSRLMGEVDTSMGRSNAATQHFDQAIEHFRRVQQLRPKDPDAAVWLALLLQRTGRDAEAKQHYQQVLQIQPDQPVALNNLAFVIAEEGGDLDVALTYAQRAKQKVPDSDAISDTLAWIYLKKKLTPNALTIYDGLVVKEPKNSTYRYHRGMALLQKGDKVQAKKEFQTALLNTPTPDEQAKINAALQKTN